MKRGRSLIYGGLALGLPSGKARKRYLETIYQFVKFLQDNKLTTRTILKRGQKGVMYLNLFSSDVTHEGYKFFRRAYDKWSEAIEQGKLGPDQTDFLAAVLAKPRGATAQSFLERAPAKSKVKATGSQKSSLRGKRVKSKPDSTFDDDYDVAGPHVHDKADWHLEGEFPEDLREDQAYVHTGLFAAWLSDRGLMTGEYVDEAKQIRRRKMTGPKVYKNWGGVLASDMLSDEGNAFTREYYDTMFCPDYEELLSRNLPSFYHVKDTWENYEILRARIDKRFQRWKAAQATKRLRSKKK